MCTHLLPYLKYQIYESISKYYYRTPGPDPSRPGPGRVLKPLPENLDNWAYGLRFGDYGDLLQSSHNTIATSGPGHSSRYYLFAFCPNERTNEQETREKELEKREWEMMLLLLLYVLVSIPL